MFDFTELADIHLEVTNNCQASCPMCPRNVNGGVVNQNVKIQNWSLADFKHIMTDRVLKQISGFYFCGNYGDPIINNDLISMIEYAVDINPSLYIRIHTNGSARTEQWWKSLATALPEKHNVIFAIDGATQDTHVLYRIGTSFETILNNASAFIAAGGTAEWCYIRFKHNEHQVDDAKLLADNLGFARFSVKNTTRFIGDITFPVYDKNRNVTHYLESPSDAISILPSKDNIDNYKQVVAATDIICKVKYKKEIYIDVYKNIYPCCWIAVIPYKHIRNDAAYNISCDMLTQHNAIINDFGGENNINALTFSIEDVINSKNYQSLWQKYWDNHELIVCAKECGKSKYRSNK